MSNDRFNDSNIGGENQRGFIALHLIPLYLASEGQQDFSLMLELEISHKQVTWINRLVVS